MAFYLLRAKYAQDSMNALVQRPEDRMLTTTKLLKEVGGRNPYRVDSRSCLPVPRVRKPWAGRRNPVGIDLAQGTCNLSPYMCREAIVAYYVLPGTQVLDQIEPELVKVSFEHRVGIGGKHLPVFAS